jgi:hypothetical protein
VKQPHRELKEGLEAYRKKLGELVTDGKEDGEAPLVGDPIGAAALADDLAVEMLAYSPAELQAIGEREFAWCRAEMEKAAAEMGFGNDWSRALEKVKEDFVPPGEQDDLAAEIAREAIEFLDEKDLVTVPDLCAETCEARGRTPAGTLQHPDANEHQQLSATRTIPRPAVA